MRQDNSDTNHDTSGRLAAVLTRDPILALDVEQVLETVGYTSWVTHDYDAAGIENRELPPLRLAVIDLSLRDSRSGDAMRWLEDRKVRTIVLATGEEDPEPHGLDDPPHIVARFLKPFVVDEILPFVQPPNLPE